MSAATPKRYCLQRVTGKYQTSQIVAHVYDYQDGKTHEIPAIGENRKHPLHLSHVSCLKDGSPKYFHFYWGPIPARYYKCAEVGEIFDFNSPSPIGSETQEIDL